MEPATTAQTPQRELLRWSIFAALVFLPAAWIAWLPLHYSVNSPSYDEWVGMAPVFQSMEKGTLGWRDFTEPHNEHRLVVPRVILFLLGRLTHYDTRWELALNWGVLLVVAAHLWKLLEATAWKPRPPTYALFTILGLLVMSPLQEQNLIFGFQFHFMVPLAFITGAFLTAIELRRPVHFWASAALASAASFSMAAGLLAWLFVFPLLARRSVRSFWRDPALAGWTALFALHVLVYKSGFHSIEESGTGLSAAFQRPGASLQYFATYLGAPFADGRVPAATALGAVILVWCAVVAAVLWLRHKAAGPILLDRALPWLLVTGLGLANAALVTAGRFHLGPSQALETRYIFYAVMTPIGLLVLTALLLETHPTPRRRRWMPAAVLGFASIFVVLHLIAVFDQLENWPALKHRRLYVKALIQTLEILPDRELIDRLTPEPDRLLETARSLDRLGYLQPPLLHSSEISTVGDPTSSGDPAFGSIDPPRQEGTRLSLMGSASLPYRLEPADTVLLTADDVQGTSRIVAMVRVMTRRADVVGRTGEPALLWSGWHHELDTAALPLWATGPLKAWAYDAEKSRAWRIPGTVPLHR